VQYYTLKAGWQISKRLSTLAAHKNYK